MPNWEVRKVYDGEIFTGVQIGRKTGRRTYTTIKKDEIVTLVHELLNTQHMSAAEIVDERDASDTVAELLPKLSAEEQIKLGVLLISENIRQLQDHERVAIKDDVMEGFCHHCGTHCLPCSCKDVK